MRKSISFLIIFIAVFSSTLHADQANFEQLHIIYVDDDAIGANNGSSWENAYKYLQKALIRVEIAKISAEIRVAQGIYKPNQYEGQPLSDRNSTFYLTNDVTIKGGYAGVNQPDPNARDFTLYQTILSGDLNGDDAEVPDAQSLLDHRRRIDNSFHVCTAYSTEPTSVIDGLYITGGNADDETIINSGGGIFCPTYLEISNCTFKNNTCTDLGGAIYNSCCGMLTITNCKFLDNASISGGAIATLSSDPIIKNCLFQKNYCLGSGGAILNSTGNPLLLNCRFIENIADSGGGIYSFCHSDPTLLNCTFIGNYATYHGGGMTNKSNNNAHMIEGCIFKDNFASSYGGSLYNTHNSKPIIKNCLFDGNRTNKWGGGLHFYDCDAEAINCTLVNNTAADGGAIGCGFENEVLPSTVRIKNCILWNNSEIIYNDDNSEITISYSCIEGMNIGRAGQTDGIINQDPCFVNMGCWADVNDPNIVVDPADPNAVWIEGDYHLKSQAGRYDPNSRSWVMDDETSPCIDAGDPNSSIGDEPFPNGGVINMGAYGGTAEASKSYLDESL